MEKELISQAKLDLACGQNKTEGYFGVDVSEDVKPDAVINLEEYPWPIASDSAEDIICNHYVEHTSDLIKFMDEIYRILKPGGKVKFVAPYYTSMRCWQDPTHKRAISEATFLYYNKQWRDVNKLDHYNIKSDFDYTYGYDMAAEWAAKHDEARSFAIRHYNNVVNDIHVVLTSRKTEEKTEDK
jgi:predicted SAM-dependent methyltransferase